ncbi:TfpX/TfpZ family type IV pilin accessory protein [Dokdonella sp.]|uniref:TfpX/TfpZ family type IV pilin accessory protein n=1 Tax=Dokdonella sp. TaxID=2291710 RepID=UPI0025C5DFBF|nr:TfpX/TfpZ family type IV pilin accessory protein [Dokdonella sp.]MBX3692115.1 hypothetical protein [Dokdonella sp.]MCW5567990.1 hypothetical protein [Dokdonella sp.]
MSRWKAAGIHLAISVLIGLAVLTLVFGVWYPSPYFQAAGGQELTLTLIGIDLVLGPLLTLVVFKAGKPGLRFDLGVIVVVQAAALLYGLHVIASARPAFIVAAVDRFVVVAANEIAPADLAEARDPRFASLPWTGPRLVAARLPSDPKERSDLLFAGFAGRDVQNQPRYFVDYAEEADHLRARAKPIAALRDRQADAAAAIDAWLKEHAKPESELAWLPVDARKASLTMLLDARTGAVLGVIAIDPN